MTGDRTSTLDPGAALLAEVCRFRAWASAYPEDQRGGEWECDYEAWDAFYRAVLAFVAAAPFERWSAEEVRAVLYAIARDNEHQHLSEEIASLHPELLLPLTRASIEGGERDDRWQLAIELGAAPAPGGEEARLLLILARDEHEYVRRRALESLARLGAPATEELALEMWSRPDPDQQWARMMALDCLHRVGSPHLDRLLAEAAQDEREHLRAFAARMRGDPARR